MQESALTRDRIAWGLAVGVLLAASLLWAGVGLAHAPPAAAAPQDDVAAEALFDAGKEAFGKKRYDEAVTLFRKALAQSDLMTEAAYWRGQAHEKLDQNHAALDAYREFLSLHASKESIGKATKTEEGLAKKAQKAIDKLGAAERDLDALNAAFVEKALAFARAQAESQPAAAREACERVLAIDPEHPDARELLASLGGGAEADATIPEAPPGPFERLAKGPWQDLIAQKTFGTKDMTYGESLLTVDKTGGAISRPTERLVMGERYVMEADFRVVEEHATSWLVGLVAGWDGAEFYAAFAQRGQVVLNRGHADKGPVEDVVVHPMKPIDPRRWHRLAVRVEGRAMVVWFDGDIVARTEVADAADLQGDIALFVQRSKVEFRLLRLATLE